MVEQSAIQIENEIFEVDAPTTESKSKNAANFSVSNQWIPQDDDALEDCGQSSAHVNVDSSDDEGDIYFDVAHALDSPRVFSRHLWPNE